MKEIAIIKFHVCDGEGYETAVATSITEWREVTEEEFRILNIGIRLYPYMGDRVKLGMVEKPVQDDVIDILMATGKREEARQIKQAEDSKAKAEAAKKKKEEANIITKAEKVKLFEKLKKELNMK